MLWQQSKRVHLPAGVGGLPHFKDVSAELRGLVVLLELGQAGGGVLSTQVPLQGGLQQQLGQQLLALRVQVGALAVDLGHVACQVLVHLSGQVAHLQPFLWEVEGVEERGQTEREMGGMGGDGGTDRERRVKKSNKETERDL